eukprot:COSAG01_NODE_9727_length_2360_cov_1.546861_4_plen_130_part_01
METQGIPEKAVLYVRWDARPHAPACFVAQAAPSTAPAPLDHGEEPRTAAAAAAASRGWLVVGVRGTLNFNDTLCDLDAKVVPFLDGRAHQGFATAAETLCGELQETVLQALDDPRCAVSRAFPSCPRSIL